MHDFNTGHYAQYYLYKYCMKILFVLTVVFALLIPNYVRSETLVISPSFGIFKEDDTIVFYGEITDSAAFNLIEVLSVTELNNLVMISPGGYMPAALLIGEYIGEYGINVTIRKNTNCMSACAYAALASDNLEINGNLMFHSPYFPTISTTDTLHETFLMSNIATLTMVEWMLYHGYTVQFYSNILETTDPSIFISFDSIEDLYQFRNSDPLAILENPSQYYTVVKLE